MSDFEHTALWRDALGMPAALASTLSERAGFAQVSELLALPSVKRVVATGNGAAFYAALVGAAAALSTPGVGPEWIAIPAGLLNAGGMAWREGDALLVLSSSGELKDVLVALSQRRVPLPFALVTAKTSSSIAQQAAAIARVTVHSQAAITHSQAFVGNCAAILQLVASSRQSAALEAELTRAPELCRRALELAVPFAQRAGSELSKLTAAVVIASGAAWPAALEAALLFKEVALLPAEGMETREGATSGMYAMTPEHLLLCLALEDDALAADAARVCADRGAQVLLAPGADLGSAELAAITSFPAALALAATLGVARGANVDRPAWSDAYFSTARTSGAADAGRTPVRMGR
jgi:fructoselysine-6-P-deglycase FrlB-like protein